MPKADDADIFREIEHTGDVGVELEAESRPELFRRAAIAIARLMVDTAAVRPVESRELFIPSAEDADLMHDMLSALLRLFLIDCFIWSDADVDEDDAGLKVRVMGEGFEPDRHEFRMEIKAITYHELSVRKVDGAWRARVIFDV